MHIKYICVCEMIQQSLQQLLMMNWDLKHLVFAIKYYNFLSLQLISKSINN